VQIEHAANPKDNRRTIFADANVVGVFVRGNIARKQRDDVRGVAVRPTAVQGTNTIWWSRVDEMRLGGKEHMLASRADIQPLSFRVSLGQWLKSCGGPEIAASLQSLGKYFFRPKVPEGVALV
jgi:hypothetical protein